MTTIEKKNLFLVSVSGAGKQVRQGIQRWHGRQGIVVQTVINGDPECDCVEITVWIVEIYKDEV